MTIRTKGQSGLDEAEAQRRLSEFGKNIIDVKLSTPWWRILARQFASVLILILFAAAVIAFFMGQTVDAMAIAAIVLLNGCLGFVQEWRAERTLESLKAMLAPQAMVRRGGVERSIDATKIVPGDLVILNAGSKVPADIDLNMAAGLRADESVLTGESESVRKEAAAAGGEDRTGQVFMGTGIVEGQGEGIVTKTGLNTEFGSIAALTANVPKGETHLQRQVGSLARYLGVFAVFLALFIILLGWWNGNRIEDMVLTGLSLAVAIVPEGLPAVVTVTLALGARAMVKRKAPSRRLQATETLGAASVINTDKTGTLTENRMTVSRIWLASGFLEVTGTGYEPAGEFLRGTAPVRVEDDAPLEALLTSAMICNHARVAEQDGRWEAIGAPTEAALYAAGLKAGLPQPDQQAIVHEIPFTSERKRMSVVTRDDGRFAVHLKGAPEVVLERCSRIAGEKGEEPLDAEWRQSVGERAAELASTGLRVLAVARKTVATFDVPDSDLENHLTFLGLFGIIDPPRPEVRQAVHEARSAGIDIVMITGDGPETAAAIARMLDLPAGRTVTGAALDQMNDGQLEQALEQGVIFARTAPHHKMRIVECLQKHNRIVAMTGDGVNDAPALKKADIGIAMGIRGTDVAKDAADLVLLDDNFASIVGAIREGRRQYENIRKFVRYLLSSNAGEVVAIVANILAGGPVIFLPIQILWMNLVTDGLTALSLGMEPSESDAMTRPPRPAREALVDRHGLLIILFFAAYTGSASLFAFYQTLEYGVVAAQTVAFTAMIFLEKFSVFAFRSLTLPVFRIGFFSNPWLLAALTVTLGAQIAAVHWPPLQRVLHTTGLDFDSWVMIVLLTVPVVVVPELVKWVIRMRVE